MQKEKIVNLLIEAIKECDNMSLLRTLYLILFKSR